MKVEIKNATFMDRNRVVYSCAIYMDGVKIREELFNSKKERDEFVGQYASSFGKKEGVVNGN